MPKYRSAKTVSERSGTLFIGGVLLLFLVLLLNPVSRRAIACSQFHMSTTGSIFFKDHEIAVEKAATNAAREKGLGGRPCMKENQAMEFTFPADDTSDHCFWMKDMRFPIDIVWLDQARVVTIAKSVEPATYPQVLCPKQPTTSVLELKAGTVEKLKMLPGDFVRH